MKLSLGTIALGAVLAAIGACKKDEAVPDAGVESAASIVEPNLGFSVSLPRSWTVRSGPDAGLASGWIADARRPGSTERPVLVTPRFAVMVEPLPAWLELDTLLEQNLTAIRAIEESGAKIQRTSKGRRTVGGVELGELRVDYRVGASGSSQDVVQRVWLVQRFGRDGQAYVLSMTTTHLASDEESLGRELESVLRSVSFEETRK